MGFVSVWTCEEREDWESCEEAKCLSAAAVSSAVTGEPSRHSRDFR